MRLLGALLLALHLGADQPVPSTVDPTGWETVVDENGIKVIAKHFPGTGLLAVRGERVIDTPINRMAWIMLDDPRAHEWVDDLADEHVVRQLNNHEYIEYNHISMPPLVSDRDFVTDVSISVDPATKSFFMHSHSIEDPSVGDPGCVRGQITYSVIECTSVDDGKRTKVTMEMHMDPRGHLPHWLVNYFQKHWPEGAFVGMVKQLAKPDLKQPPEWHEVLTPLDAWSVQ